jgi:hypothetical protein
VQRVSGCNSVESNREASELKTSAAYDTVYQTVYKALPDLQEVSAVRLSATPLAKPHT